MKVSALLLRPLSSEEAAFSNTNRHKLSRDLVKHAGCDSVKSGVRPEGLHFSQAPRGC